jgi:hypothetical protein
MKKEFEYYDLMTLLFDFKHYIDNGNIENDEDIKEFLLKAFQEVEE